MLNSGLDLGKMLLAHTFNIGTGELAVILLVALVVFGPNKLPEVARQAGKAMRTFRKISNSFRDEIRDAMAQPVEQDSAESDPTDSSPASSSPAGSSRSDPPGE